MQWYPGFSISCHLWNEPWQATVVVSSWTQHVLSSLLLCFSHFSLSDFFVCHFLIQAGVWLPFQSSHIEIVVPTWLLKWYEDISFISPSEFDGLSGKCWKVGSGICSVCIRSPFLLYHPPLLILPWDTSNTPKVASHDLFWHHLRWWRTTFSLTRKFFQSLGNGHGGIQCHYTYTWIKLISYVD